jgi:hypothetical protein
MVASEVNEADEDLLNSKKSLGFNVVMLSTNDALSPILDTHRTSLIAISNKVNNPSETNLNVDSLDANVLISGSAAVTIAGSTITTPASGTSTDTATQAAFKTATVGKYLTIAGASTGTSTKLITAVAADGTSITFNSAPTAVTGNVTLTQRERFVAENAPLESSTYSKYVTKRVNLANHSNYIRVKFAANIPAEASIEVWYKTNIVGSNTPFENASYTQMTIDAGIPTSSNAQDQFYDASYSVDDLVAFDAIQVKIVMKSSNSSQVPRIKDLRVLACV